MGKGLHDGHRHRLRERFRQNGLDGFAPHEVVELLLFYARSRGDVNGLAHQLLERFGSLKGLFEAGTEQMLSVPGVGEETATLLSLIVPLFRVYQKSLCEDGVYLKTCAQAKEYCRALLVGCKTERFYVVSFSAQLQVLGRRLVGEGSLNEVPAYPRAVAEAALNHNAFGVILCHNHPGGMAQPSETDILMTHRLEAVLEYMDICLFDHIIVTDKETYSMAQNDSLKRKHVRTSIGDAKCREEEQKYF